MIPVFIYLLAVVLANIIILWVGPQATVITAFLFIGLDLTLRDKLNDQWYGKQLWWKNADLDLRRFCNFNCTQLGCAQLHWPVQQPF